MNMWENAVLTDKGVTLLAKLAAGDSLTITKAEAGAGSTTAELKIQTSVTTPKQELTFRPVSYPGTGKVAITCHLSNTSLTTGYTATQIGIYATDPDDGEVLLYLAQAADGTGVTVPSASEMAGFSADWTFYLQFSNADSITIVVSDSGTVSQDGMEAYVASALQTLSDRLTAHINDKDNPHEVTAAQISGAKTASFTATLMASNWSGTSAPYSQTVSVSELPAAANGCVGVSPSATDAQFTAAADAMLRVSAQAAEKVTIKAYGDKPTVNIPITISAVWEATA